MRRVLAGPSSSQGNYKATLDPGASLPSGQSGAYRRTGNASGPQSSHAVYSPTLDPGVATGVSGGQTAVQPMVCSGCNFTNVLGGKFCSSCGTQLFE